MDPTLLPGFAVTSTAILLIPGPAVLLVLSHALGKGRRVAVPTALGVATGDLAAMTASLAGFGALIATSASLFFTLEWAVAACLVWLGIALMRSAEDSPVSTPTCEATELGAGAAFVNSAIVMALNPKSIAFFIAFVPQFIDPVRFRRTCGHPEGHFRWATINKRAGLSRGRSQHAVGDNAPCSHALADTCRWGRAHCDGRKHSDVEARDRVRTL